MERATLENLKKGVYFFFPDVCNPISNNYGALLCTGVSVKTRRYNETWNDGWSRLPDHYVQRQQVAIRYLNASGEEDEMIFWKDEFEGNLFPESKPHIADTKEEIYTEIKRQYLTKKYQEVIATLRNEFLCDSVVRECSAIDPKYKEIYDDANKLYDKMKEVLV